MSNRLKFLVWLVIILGLGTGLWYWMSIADYGYMEIRGDLPDQITGLSLGGQTCPETPCRLKVLSGRYRLVFTKADNYSLEKDLSIRWLETTSVTLQFVGLPHLEYVGDLQNLSLPLANTMDGYKDNQQDVELKYRASPISLPLSNVQKVQGLFFSPDGRQAVVLQDRKQSLFDSTSLKKEWNLAEINDIHWADTSSFYFWDKKANSWGLQLFHADSGQQERVATFFNLKKPSLFASSTQLIVADETGNYLMDLQQKSKKTILEGYLLQDGKIDRSGKMFLFQAGQKSGTYNIASGITGNLPDALQLPFLDLIDFYESADFLLYPSLDSVTQKWTLHFYPLGSSTSNLLQFDIPSPGQDIAKIQVNDKDIYLLSSNQKVYRVSGQILLSGAR